MKSDTERKRYYTEKLHKRRNRLHVHLSKDLRGELKAKKRAVLVRKGDTVRVMRGPSKGKEAKVGRVDVLRRKVFLEGVTVTNIRAKEMPLALEPSNLMLIGLESTKERKEIFKDEAFRKKEPAKPKTEAKTEAQKAEAKADAPKAEAKTEPAKAETATAEPRHTKHETSKHETPKHETSKHEAHEAAAPAQNAPKPR